MFKTQFKSSTRSGFAGNSSTENPELNLINFQSDFVFFI